MTDSRTISHREVDGCWIEAGRNISHPDPPGGSNLPSDASVVDCVPLRIILTRIEMDEASSLHVPPPRQRQRNARGGSARSSSCHTAAQTSQEKQAGQGDDQPPATSTHSERQLPDLPSTSTMSSSHRHRQPTPFSLTGSGCSQ